MGTTRTADKAKRTYIAVMGEPLGSIFHALWQEVAWLHRKWDEYVELYGTKSSRVDLLNKAAPTFFRIVQDVLWQETLLHIARLSDPPSSAGKPNLTIQRLPPLVADAEVAQRVKTLTEKAVEASAFCRDWRNRRIAHRDLNLALENGAIPLSPASREKVKLALNAFVDVLNAVTQHYMDSTSFFDVGGHAGGAASLIYVIDDGLRAEAERQARHHGGEVRAEDLRRRDL